MSKLSPEGRAEHPWKELRWSGPSSFSTRNFHFECSVVDYTNKTNDDRIILLKDRTFLENYDRYLPSGLGNVFELGFFQGGMPLLLADTVAPNKIVAIDRGVVGSEIAHLLRRTGLDKKISLHQKVDQGDQKAIRSILDSEFGDEPLDLIIDDCSHEYEMAKRSFEATFGYLRAGAKFIIEDWGWAHWPGEPWQSDKSFFHGRPALTNLLFEVIMAQASAPGIIASVEVPTPYMAIVTRGPNLPHKAKIELSSIYLTAGREFSLL